ncbi:MAG: DUF2281 domain-containing protein [Candidatus Riflebacteria bacterium]|nr:DUF2281 domain-containing protein [Candidatus Riflebacteria bacterium]
MNQRELWRELKALPHEAQREVIDFIAFLRARHGESARTGAVKRPRLSREPFVGMWEGRRDMEDSTEWVRTARQREWEKP